MTPRPSLALALALLSFSSFPAVSSVGSTATLAVVSSSIVCGITAVNNSIQCSHLASPSPHSFTLLPNVAFRSVAAGRGDLCALRAGGTAVVSWNAGESAGGRFVGKRIYKGGARIAELTAGVDHFAAVDQNRTRIMWWRQSFSGEVSGEFHSLTSGHGFSCAVAGLAGDGAVRCWGSNGTEIEAAFENRKVTSVVAGDSHVCGLGDGGEVFCAGANDAGQSEQPAGEFRSLALGSRHTCGVRRSDSSVVCWGGAGSGVGRFYEPTNRTAFEFLVAGGDLTCGVKTSDFSVLCWSANQSVPTVSELPLSPILPGLCSFSRSSCECGVYPDSQNLCSNSAVICKQCESPVMSSSSPLRRSDGRWLAFALVGLVGGFIGICAVLYCLWFQICRHKKIHNSVQPTLTSSTNATAGLISMVSLKPQSSSKSRAFRRQGLPRISRQRSGTSSIKDGAKEFSFIELAAATTDFSTGNKIGSGSFGNVYKGKLVDSRKVAIKRGKPETKAKWIQEKETAFQSEISLLSRLHHKHLIALVGYCKEKEERLLVYEFMKNGSLYDHLHSSVNYDSPILSSWRMRIKVLLDSARGIEYLHNYAMPQIIHRDIKSSNILLDSNWVAKVSDFGLSLTGTRSKSSFLSMRAAGTVGYIDPEYYGLQNLTVKSDIYGLGVVMLEALTGKRAVFQGDAGNPTSVVEFALPVIVAGEVDKVLDTRLSINGQNEGQAVERVAYTAIRCLRLEGKERPNISDVVSNLEGALAMCEDNNGSLSSTSVSFEFAGRD